MPILKEEFPTFKRSKLLELMQKNVKGVFNKLVFSGRNHLIIQEIRSLRSMMKKYE